MKTKKIKHKKIIKKKKAIKKVAKKKVVKKTKKPTKKAVKKVKPKKLTLSQKKAENLDTLANMIIEKGRKRGFITYDEILKTFPDIENNILFLDELYEKFSVAGIDVLEGGNLLNLDLDINDKDLNKGSMHDSIQMYLKEIGQYPLIRAGDEKDLAKRIEQGDEEAKNLFPNARIISPKIVRVNNNTPFVYEAIHPQFSMTYKINKLWYQYMWQILSLSSALSILSKKK